MLSQVSLSGRVVTGDALYAQRRLCRQIMAGGGEYLFIVKRNQLELYEDIALLFTEPPPGEVFLYAQQRGQHGDRREVRRLWASTALEGYVNWPGVRQRAPHEAGRLRGDPGQVCKVEREAERKGRRSVEVRYAITSLGSEVGARRLLDLVRGHWGIENCLYWVRDVTLGEDVSQVRKGAAPQVMAALRNVVLGLLRCAGTENIAAALRENGWRQGAALKFLHLLP